MKQPKVIIGIDPGSSNGGIAIWKKGEKVKTILMPKNEEIDKLKDFLVQKFNQEKDTVVFIEKVQMFGSDSLEENKGKHFRIQVMLRNYERIIGVILVLGIPYIEVYPQSWQSTLNLRRKWKDNQEKKNAFKTFAQNCFPEIKVTLWSSDALCLIQFAFRKYSDAPNWISKNIKNVQNDLFS